MRNYKFFALVRKKQDFSEMPVIFRNFIACQLTSRKMPKSSAKKCLVKCRLPSFMPTAVFYTLKIPACKCREIEGHGKNPCSSSLDL